MLGTIGTGGSVVLTASVGMVAGYYWEKCSEGGAGSGVPGRFPAWLTKGFGLPVLIWLTLNTGWIPGVAPLTPVQSGPAPGSLAWLAAMPERFGASVAVMASWWGVVTLAWLLAITVRGLGKRDEVRAVVKFWGLWMLLPTVYVVIGGGFWAMGYALLIPLGTILHGLLPLRMTRSPLPLMFGRAIGHMKMGRYEAAERAALEELEKNPEDYEGWMLLAELYAERFQDLVLADQTIRDLCDQPGCSGIQISLALHRLADWQLKLGEDPRAARSALEGIIQRLPETHFARMALQRIGQLPADRDELRERKRARPLRLPALKDPLDDDAEGGLDGSSMTKSEAVERANRLVERLKADPNAAGPREELAYLLAGPLDRVDAALEQVRLLLGMPVRPPEKVPEWLALMAAWHLHRRNDREAARPFLEELVRGHPRAPQAFAAQRRLNVMDLHQRAKGG